MPGPADQTPTLLVGAEQSGTTLLRLMLDSHPEVAFAEEFEYSVLRIGPDGTFPPMPDYRRWLRTQRSFSTSGFEIDPTRSYRELIEGFLEERRCRKDAVAIGATMHHGFSRAGHLWPDAKIIHLVRDPRDVAPARMAAGLAGNVWHGVDSWVETEDEWARLAPTLDPSRVLTIQFADLIRDHELTLDEICRFIGVDYTAQMLDYADDTDYRPPSATVAGDWHDSLSARDVRLVEARIGHRLTSLGFEPSGLPELTVTDTHRSRLAWQDRFGRVMRRIELIGLTLTTADLLARAVANEPMQRSMQRRLTAAERARRKKSWSDNAKYRTSR